MKARVFATPALLRNGDLDGSTAVVIDALRMTSVAAVAIANGCAGLMAVGEVDEARACAEAHGALLGGERNAVEIAGFDFSNSPETYTAERVRGRRLVMTTTNGTKAIAAASGADRLLLGAFVNASAVAAAVRGADLLGIVCAGTMGAFTLEDALAAGAILWRLARDGADLVLDDMAIAALTLYEGARRDLHAALSKTSHYNRLQRLGLMDDLRFCLSEDIVSAVPTLGADNWFTA